MKSKDTYPHNPITRMVQSATAKKIGSAVHERAAVASVEVRYTGDPARVDRFVLPIVTSDGKK